MVNPVSVIPPLARLQAERGGKSWITIRVDNATLAFFKARAKMAGSHYQTLMNEALQQFAQGQTLADMVRDTLREELRRTQDCQTNHEFRCVQ